MNDTILNVLIADDEVFIREGLKVIIDWHHLGFDICGEAQDGMDALEKMKALRPGLVLLDIQMPLLSGIELIKAARESGYEGEFIILSGFSDFQYAQAAISYGVSCYLTKPIDEALLTQAVLSAKEKLLNRLQTKDSYRRYLGKAKSAVLTDLLRSPHPDTNLHYEEFGFTFSVYQIVLYETLEPESAHYEFGELFAAVCGPNDSYESLTLEERNLLLLKGHSTLTRFQTFLSRCQRRIQKGSPLDAVFLAWGRPVYGLEELHASYLECCRLMERRFFCPPDCHVIGPADADGGAEPKDDVLQSQTFTGQAKIQPHCFTGRGNPPGYYSTEQKEQSSHSDKGQKVQPPYYGTSREEQPAPGIISQECAEQYARELSDYVKSGNRKMLAQTLDVLESRLLSCPDSVTALKHFLADILLQVRSNVTQSYSQAGTLLCSNAALLEQIAHCRHLSGILSYYMEQFELMISAIGGSTDAEGVFENILDYINHNYGEALKLETLAPLFGYNSSYLGKLFTQRVGQNFNSYLNEVRVRNAADALLESNLTISAIASRCGYRSVDYFYQKFKLEFGCSPAEYRRKHGNSNP